MPFKTKKRKKSANTRRITISQQGLAVYESYQSRDKVEDSSIQEVEIKTKKVTQDVGNYNYVKGEIVKISALASIIIGLQVALRISHIAF